MNKIIYKFDTVNCIRTGNYIFHKVCNRKLTNIYHAHDFYEWSVLVEGSCTQIINENEFTSDKFDCWLLSPGDRHKFIYQSDKIKIIAISVKKEEFMNLWNIFSGSSNYPTFFSTTVSINEIEELTPFFNANEEIEYKLFLAHLIKIYENAQKRNENIPLNLETAIREINKIENLKGGVERLVQISGYSQAHLLRLMNKYYNTSLHSYIMDIRLSAAYNEIIMTRTNIEEISESVGYSSFSHFNKIFKKKYGITPAALRKKHGTWTT